MNKTITFPPEQAYEESKDSIKDLTSGTFFRDDKFGGNLCLKVDGGHVIIIDADGDYSIGVFYQDDFHGDEKASNIIKTCEIESLKMEIKLN